MSAFIVEDKTINKIVTYIKEECYRDPWFHTQFIEGNGYCGTWDKLAQAMYDLNKEAVDYRYKWINSKRKVTYCPELYGNLYQALKSLDCFLYQCAEGQFRKNRSISGWNSCSGICFGRSSTTLNPMMRLSGAN